MLQFIKWSCGVIGALRPSARRLWWLGARLRGTGVSIAAQLSTYFFPRCRWWLYTMLICAINFMDCIILTVVAGAYVPRA